MSLPSAAQREAQKLRFLASVCDACKAAVADHTTWDAVYFCQLEVAQRIKVRGRPAPRGAPSGWVLGTALPAAGLRGPPGSPRSREVALVGALGWGSPAGQPL